MAVGLVLAGLAMVIVVVRDVVHELFHPAGTGMLSRALRRATWRLFRRLAASRPERLSRAGPATLLVVVTAWTTLSVLGWALVYLPFMPGSFRYASGLDPAANADFGTAVYLSLTALATLGFGDMTPTSLPLRLATTGEALQGFLILTAGISWALAIKPVLAERRALAAAIHVLLEAERETGRRLDTLPPDDLRQMLVSLGEQLTLARSRLLQSPETYYFRPRSADLALAAVLPALLDRTRALESRADAGTGLLAVSLGHAIGDFADVLSAQFVGGGGDRAATLAAYADDHLWPRGSGGG